MTRPRFTIVAAIAANGVIGADGDLAWRDADDLRRVKALTMGHTLVMGRKNFESIGRPLPGRRTIVATRQPTWAADGITVVHDLGADLDDALESIIADTDDPEVYVFGGAEIYEQLFDRVEAMELTEIESALPGDVHFPSFQREGWWEIRRELRDGYSWVRYVRKLEPVPAC